MTPPFVHRLRVRYNECDMQGIVFNSHYYTWMDIGHTELIREVVGPVQDVFYVLGVDVMVAESSARYRASARYDQEIDIEVELGGADHDLDDHGIHLPPRRRRTRRRHRPPRLCQARLLDQDPLARRDPRRLQPAPQLRIVRSRPAVVQLSHQ